MAAATEKMRETDSPWMTAKEAAEYLGIHLDSLYRAMKKKGLKYAQLGKGTIRLRREWLDQWVEERARQSPHL